MIENINDDIRGTGSNNSPRTPGVDRPSWVADGSGDSPHTRSPDDKDASGRYKRSHARVGTQLEVIEESDSGSSSGRSDKDYEASKKNGSN